MPFYVYVTAVVVATALAVIGATLYGTRRRDRPSVRENLDMGRAPSSRDVVLDAPIRDRVFDPLFATIARRARLLSSDEGLGKTERRLILSGLAAAGWTVERMLVIRFLAGGLGITVAGLLVSGDQSRNTLLQAMLLVAIALLGPNIWLDRKATEQQADLERRLPDAIDQIAVNIEAGLGFENALQKVASGRPGPLNDELSRVLQDIRVGASRTEAFEWLLDRTDVPDLRQFVAAIRQSALHGVPISTVLRVQSDEIREKRQGRIEEKAAQLPVKIVFPLVFFILPALFVIVLGPAALNITDGL